MQHSTRLGLCWIGREIHGCCERYEGLYKPLIQAVPRTEKWVTSAVFKKILAVVLAARILTVDFVVCTLAVKKKSGQVSTCRIGPFPCESNACLAIASRRHRYSPLEECLAFLARELHCIISVLKFILPPRLSALKVFTPSALLWYIGVGYCLKNGNRRNLFKGTLSLQKKISQFRRTNNFAVHKTIFYL
jgi:hypothetical protein